MDRSVVPKEIRRKEGQARAGRWRLTLQVVTQALVETDDLSMDAPFSCPVDVSITGWHRTFCFVNFCQ